MIHLEAIAAKRTCLPAWASSTPARRRSSTRRRAASLQTFAFALLVVLLVLAAQFESFISAIILMATVPFGLAAAMFAMLLTGGSLNIYSQIGLVMLVGLMSKNGILIVEFANQLRDQGQSVRDAIRNAALIRLRPVVMTMIATVLGGLPLLLTGGAGAEARQALGWIIVGGLGFATLVTLFLTPVVFSLLARFSKPRIAEQQRLERELGGGSRRRARVRADAGGTRRGADSRSRRNRNLAMAVPDHSSSHLLAARSSHARAGGVGYRSFRLLEGGGTGSVGNSGANLFGRARVAQSEGPPDRERVRSDQALMNEIANGSDAAFARLLGELSPRMLRFARSLLPASPGEADEIVQEAFLRLWQQAPAWRPEGRISTWLHQVVYRLCLDQLRRRRPSVEIDAVEAELEDDAPSAGSPPHSHRAGRRRPGGARAACRSGSARR